MEISARDEAGQAVDWWFAYKAPMLLAAQGDPQTTGYEYAYYDATSSALVQSAHTMNADAGCLHETLDGIFPHPDPTTGWILYNDERPPGIAGKDVSALGHTKGVLAFDVASGAGLWLLHSWPKYIDPAQAGMPTPMYGQTFICLSLTLADIEAIATQMVGNQQPEVFGNHLPDGLAATSPIRTLAGKINPNAPSSNNTISLTTRGGLGFKVIAKDRKWNDDFWNDLVGPTLGEDMDVETWIRGPIPPQADSDGVHKTIDIKYIDFRKLGIPWTWPETQDHAKWGITTAGNWVCVGDINRMISQRQRGGGTIAFQDAGLWGQLSQTDLIIPTGGHDEASAKRLLQRTGNEDRKPPAGGQTDQVR